MMTEFSFFGGVSL